MIRPPARMTEGRLTKKDLTYNPQGAIVSKKKSKLMKTNENPSGNKIVFNKTFFCFSAISPRLSPEM
mgnify:CR=1 FL=1